MILPSEQKKGYYRKSMEKLKEKIKKERIKTDGIKILVRTNNKRMISLCRKNYYLDTERHEKETKRRWKIFDLPYNAGYCPVSWKDDQWSFSYRT